MERKRDMKKRIISLILVVIMLCSLLAGCAGNGGGSKASNKLTVGINQNSNITSFDDNAFTKYIEDTLNIKLEFIYFAKSPKSIIWKTRNYY